MRKPKRRHVGKKKPERRHKLGPRLETWFTAIHEAAHAVAALLFDIESLGAIVGPFVEPDGSECLGCLVLKPGHLEQRLLAVSAAKSKGDARAEVMPLLLLHFFGPIAELRAKGELADFEYMFTDIPDAVDLAAFAICPGEHELASRGPDRDQEPYRTEIVKLLESAITKAGEYIVELEPAIWSVACKLVVKGRVSTPEMDRMVRAPLIRMLRNHGVPEEELEEYTRLGSP